MRQNNRRKFSDLSVSTKTVLLLTVFVFLPVMVTGGVILERTYKNDMKAQEKLIYRALNDVAERIDQQLNAVMEKAERLGYENAINELLSGKQRKGIYIEADKCIDDAFDGNELIAKIQILTSEAVLWQSGTTGYAFSDEGNEEYADKIWKDEEFFFWTPSHDFYSLKDGKFQNPVKMVSYYQGIYNKYEMNLNGVLAIHLPEASICNLYQDFLQGGPKNAWLMKKDGSVISSINKEWLVEGIPIEIKTVEEENMGNFNVKYLGKTKKVYWKKCDSIDGYLMQMNENISFKVQYTRFAVIAIFIFAVLCGSYIIAYRRWIIKPLRLLTMQMERAGNWELKQEMPCVTGDEIGILNVNFQNMLHRINDLIENVYLEQIRTQEAEQKAMLAQINPHFLYNTLDSIRWNALSHGQKDTSEQLEALAVMLRNTLNFGKKESRIEEELQIIESYCFLLEARFHGSIKVSIEVEPEVRQYVIPKLLVQPLVENAYKHGLENKTGDRELSVKMLQRKNMLWIYVADNGVGCDRKQLMERLESEDAQDCFALKNIKKRIRSVYGTEGHFLFYSRLGEGTIVKLILPIRKGNGKQNSAVESV